MQNNFSKARADIPVHSLTVFFLKIGCFQTGFESELTPGTPFCGMDVRQKDQLRLQLWEPAAGFVGEIQVGEEGYRLLILFHSPQA